MVGIAFRFLAGRYHATAWDHHVNEGTVEWPPSPWRLLRAFVAAAHRLHPAPSRAELESLLFGALGSPPRYCLPVVGEGHTRHYMPGKGGSTTLVFDAFVAPGSAPGAADGELTVAWDASLDGGQADLLDRILEQLTYLGRAESWVAARRTTPCGPFDAAPDDAGETTLLAPMTPEAFATWREGYLAADPRARRKLPTDLWAALTLEIGQMQGAGWSTPPGARWVRYRVRQRARRRPWRTSPSGRLPTVALYQLSGPVLPRVEESVTVADRVRASLMSRSKGDDNRPLPVFSGRSPDGSPLDDDHAHAYYLPWDEDRDGRLDHVVVAARWGFDLEARAALESFRRFWGPGGHEVRVSLVGLDVAGKIVCGLAKRARTWQSATPFMLNRHPKLRSDGKPKRDADGRWIEGPEWQLRRELRAHGFPEPAHVQEVEALELRDRSIPWYRFRRERLKGGGRRFGHRAYGFRITFAEAVQGPIALGYAAHHGLGLFMPV